LSKEDAEQIEIKLIAERGTLDPEKGYNLDPGGCVSSPTLETRRKLSESCRGRVFSPETRAKLSAAKKGRPSNRRGQKLSPETRQKISEAHRNNPHGSCVKVVCVETGECFASMTDAGRAKNVPCSKISMCCAGKQKTAGGYHWEYYNDTPIFDTQIFARKEVKENDR